MIVKRIVNKKGLGPWQAEVADQEYLPEYVYACLPKYLNYWIDMLYSNANIDPTVHTDGFEVIDIEVDAMEVVFPKSKVGNEHGLWEEEILIPFKYIQ